MNLPLPEYLQIEPVDQCNLRCQMCPIQFRQDGPPYGPPAFMQFDVFTNIIDQFTGLETLHLQGLGEPMMHPQFFEMVEYAKVREIRVTTNSNLTLLNARRAEGCLSSGLDELHISIDGAQPETYYTSAGRPLHGRVRPAGWTAGGATGGVPGRAPVVRMGRSAVIGTRSPGRIPEPFFSQTTVTLPSVRPIH